MSKEVKDRNIIKRAKQLISRSSNYINLKNIARVVSVAFVSSFILGNVFTNIASAAQIEPRSIEMSESAISTGTYAADGQNVSYNVSFTTATTGAIEGIVVDFCSNDPIIGDTTCNAPTGFTVGATPTTNATYTGLNPTTATSWTKASANSGRTFILSDASANTSITAPTAISFTITGVTNPSVLGSFYARIYTYTTAAGATGYSAATPGTYEDAGGIALSIDQEVIITAKVQEQITFCVYTSSLDSSLCSYTPGTNGVSLGNTNGVLSSAGPFVDLNTHYDIQTNATNSAIIRIYSPTTGGTLTTGTVKIESSTSSGTGATAGTAYASTTGAAQFGLCTYPVATGTGTPTNLTIAATYASNGGSTYNGSGTSPCLTDTSQTSGTGTPGGASAGSTFGYNLTNITAPYGDTLATQAPGNYTQGTIAYMANIPITQTAGIYTVVNDFIATGSY